MISTSFMTSKGNKDTRLGHANESVIMGNAISETRMDEIKSFIKIDFTCEVGLIRSVEKDYLHASPDYILCISDDVNETNYFAFAEIKCRTRIHTANLENQISIGDDRWIRVKAGSNEFKRYVRSIKERMQLIHQAATLQCTKGLLAIGDANGNLLRGIWIDFDIEQLASYKRCIEDIFKDNFQFTTNAIKGIEKPVSYIDSETKRKVIDAIKKQQYIDYDSFLYNFNFWVSMRKQGVALTSSKRCIPLLASIWNRSKNGSDVATGMMRAAWYPLPNTARTPSALVVQRILFLVMINIMRIATFLTINGKGSDFNIDQFRNRSNKMFGSHRSFLLHLRNKCISPLIKNLKKRQTVISFNVQMETRNSESAPSPIEDSSPRRTRANAKTMTILNVKDSLKVTSTTPPTKKGNSAEIEKRILTCTNPCVASLVTKGKKCVRCNKVTRFMCLGCHQHFCMTVSDAANIDSDAPKILHDEAETFEVHLGKRKAKIQLNELTPQGNRKRKVVMQDVKIKMYATCFHIAHRHLLSKDVN